MEQIRASVGVAVGLGVSVASGNGVAVGVGVSVGVAVAVGVCVRVGVGLLVGVGVGVEVCDPVLPACFPGTLKWRGDQLIIAYPHRIIAQSMGQAIESPANPVVRVDKDRVLLDESEFIADDLGATI